ncbi:MAG: ATP-dependent helicase, partial [Haloarculaceae archaeon]
MGGRQLLAEQSLDFDPTQVDVDDGEVLELLEPAVREWWVEQFGAFVPENGGFFTPPQKEAIPHIHEGRNALVAAPTGSGKTLSAFTAIINELFRRDRQLEGGRASSDDLDSPTAGDADVDSPAAGDADVDSPAAGDADVDSPAAGDADVESPTAGDADVDSSATPAEADESPGLENSVYCLYVSPLKSLANDIHRNLEVPLAGITERLEDRGEEVEIRHAIRHGDTPDAERQAMLEETPHILNTTPETLAILLNAPKFREKLRTVEYVVVDEIHSLAENKRGTHLSVSLERLEHLAESSPTRVGCSATVEPLDTMAEFLVGRSTPGGGARECEIVDARFTRDLDVELTCPTDDLVHTPRATVKDRFYSQLQELIKDHTNTIVFTNTRSGAERVLHNLRERDGDGDDPRTSGGYDESNSACHHGSLSKDRRQRVERRLKGGDLDVVTTSTSLELGIDMPHVDLVVQVGSPKSVAALLQRIGRAGHQLGQTVTGRVVALDRDELVECAVMLQKATEGFVDRVFVPENASDVAAQHVYGMAIEGPRPEAEVRGILERAYPFREYDDERWEQLLRYLTADFDGLEDRNVYPKVWRDTNDPPDGQHHYEAYDVGEALVGKRGRMARVIYMTNLGTIPDSFTVDVFTRGDEEWIGQLDEEYLDTLDAGEVFVLGGERYEHRYRRGSKVYVDPTNARPTVPSWYSERLPLSYDLGRAMLDFQRDLLDHYENGGPSEVRVWLREYPLDEHSVQAITRTFDEQLR